MITRFFYIYAKYSGTCAGNKCWASIYLGDTESRVNRDVEAVELQVGYNLTEKLDVNIRYFIYDVNATGADFQKTEARLRYKF